MSCDCARLDACFGAMLKTTFGSAIACTAVMLAILGAAAAMFGIGVGITERLQLGGTCEKSDCDAIAAAIVVCSMFAVIIACVVPWRKCPADAAETVGNIALALANYDTAEHVDVSDTDAGADVSGGD